MQIAFLWRVMMIILATIVLVPDATAAEKFRVITRQEWGADDSLLFAEKGKEEESPVDAEEKTTETQTISERLTECEEERRLYPGEFVPARTVNTAPSGKPYRWPMQYSREVKLLVVHHTAIAFSMDIRTSKERMRALYRAHADGRGWGDMGYHYVVAEDGAIFEGRAGGDHVVGGHVYCNNIGTIGVALMGNFEIEEPTQAQIRSLQWLLKTLADRYGIDLRRSTVFHGKRLPSVIGHRDLLTTDCPGYSMYGTLEQVRANVARGALTAAVRFPPPRPRTEIATREPKSRAAEAAIDVSKRGRRLGRLARRIRTAQRLSDRFPATSRSTGTSLRRNQKNQTSQRIQRTFSSGPSESSEFTRTIRIRLTSQEKGETICDTANLNAIRPKYRGTIECRAVDGKAAIINEVSIEDYMLGLAEEPDTEPIEKQRAFAIAARSYAAHYANPFFRKFPGAPYDGDDSAARFQLYGGRAFEERNPQWANVVRDTTQKVLTKDGNVVRAAYFSISDGRTRSPEENGWTNFPFAEIFSSKPDPWCRGMKLSGHGVGMSGCGAGAQAREGKTAEEILRYYYPGTVIQTIDR